MMNNPKSLNHSLLLLLALLPSLIPAVAGATVSEPIEGIVAIVNDDIITRLELADEINTIKRNSRQQNMSLPGDDVLRKQVLDRMILMRLQMQTAKRGNIRVSDDALNGAIESIARQNNMDLLQFRQALEQRGYDYASYRERIRKEMTISQLQKRQVDSRVIVTEQEVDDFLANQKVQGSANDEYRLEHILVTVPEAANAEQIQAAKQRAQGILEEIKGGEDFAQVAIAQSDGQQALQGGDLGWRKLVEIPTLFADVVPTMAVGDTSDLIRSPSGFHIIHLADKRHSQNQHIVEQTKARHILIKPNNIVTTSEVRTRLEQLRQRVENGENFAALAAANSEDRVSAANGGELGWISPGDMVPEFEAQMNKLKPGEISQPFRSRFGWHIVQVEARRKHDNTKSFQRNQAREILHKRKLEPAVENWLRRLRDEAFVEVRL
jgi:peptidyl-prolyl cis-trans isomerase SurA